MKVIFDPIQIKQLFIHQLLHGDHAQLKLSQYPTVVSYDLEPIVLEYLLHAIKKRDELEQFTFSNEDFTLNPLFQFAQTIFADNSLLGEVSGSIAKHLYQVSTHPNIKSGDLCIALFDDIAYEDQMIQALGIFKSETKDEFLKITKEYEGYDISSDIGLSLNKLDKACLIYNIEPENGYVLSVIDRSNGNSEAQYWREAFINSRPLQDEYLKTLSYMNMAQTYISHQIAEEFEVERPDQIDLLNKSAQYFKEKESLSQEEFKNEVLQHEDLIQSFEAYSESYQAEMNVDLSEDFGLSKKAVKKTAKDFKSVLKLDKNFHVYIHGDRTMIERGTDEDGRKYYKLYYEQEN